MLIWFFKTRVSPEPRFPDVHSESKSRNFLPAITPPTGALTLDVHILRRTLSRGRYGGKTNIQSLEALVQVNNSGNESTTNLLPLQVIHQGKSKAFSLSPATEDSRLNMGEWI